ncbi:unnamed protein product [Heligmosomoides polygyrus]|uniref:Zot domain-containing protein n=1 Tax=Heligmosomoides polygyrus TaxID=6339 RepID=A0A183GDG6_HELPZ|nr:unnamed protein product [Heligmosomoides polygyrus]
METNNNASAKDRLQSTEGQLRSFKYKNGSLVDNGFELKARPKAIGRKRGENRRATCPEIYLCPESNLPARQVVVRLYGSRNSGKKTLAHQIYHIASTTTPDQTHVLCEWFGPFSSNFRYLSTFRPTREAKKTPVY